MRAPAFWQREEASAAALALAPAGWLYGALTARRMAQPGALADAPVACVGNFVAGGAGKTPTALALARLLQRAGRRVAFLSRGYGGAASRSARPLRVEPDQHDAGLVGDEPLLLARAAATFVGADRVASASAAVAAGANVLVMDDGLQNPALAKQFRLAVVDGASGVGNGLCLPAGPLRAPLEAQLEHTDAVLVIGDAERDDETPGARVAGRASARGLPVFYGRLAPDPAAAARLRGRRVVGFAGIGRPEKFFATLEALGADLVDAYSFADHQTLGADDLASLRAAAQRHHAQLVTTEKDAARLGAQFGDDMTALPVTLLLSDEAAFAAFALRALKARPNDRA